MFDRIERSWRMLKATIEIVLNNPKLLVFPAVNLIFITLIVAFFLVPALTLGTGASILTAQHWDQIGHRFFEYAPGKHGEMEPAAFKVGWGVFLAALYVPSMFFATFLNVSLYSQIFAAFRGETISIRNGLAFAGQRVWAILGWSLFAGAVGYIIRTLEERVGFIGRLILGLVGTAWSVACVFTIPVIVCQPETKSPFSILKESAGTLRQTWGEALTGYVGLSGANLLVLLSGLGFVGVSIALALALNQLWIIVVACLLFAICFVTYAYIVGVAQQVFIAALYLYATQGAVAAPYSAEMFAQAWKTKKN